MSPKLKEIHLPAGATESGYSRLRGYHSKLTKALIAELYQSLLKGYTKADSAALAGISKQLLDVWLKRGNDQLERRKISPYTDLVLAVDRAQAQYRSRLIDCANSASETGKRVDGKWIRWRLALGAPEFHEMKQQPPDEEEKPDQISPEEARARLEERLALFLSKHEPSDTAAPEAPTTEEQPT